MLDKFAKHLGKMALRPQYRRQHFVLNNLAAMPSYSRATTSLLGSTLTLVDAPNFVPSYREIFEQHIYKFRAKTDKPFVIDGGANIGLSVLYIKQMYPNSHVIAFEPDNQVFDVLGTNIRSFGLNDVELVNKALWTCETDLNFASEGSVAGRIATDQTQLQAQCVKSVRLYDYLDRHVDFLKLDIEGAETEVIYDCRERLGNVDNIFVEYHSYVSQPQTLLNLVEVLTQNGFRLHLQSPSVINPSPLFDRNTHHGMDALINIFGYKQ